MQLVSAKVKLHQVLLSHTWLMSSDEVNRLDATLWKTYTKPVNPLLASSLVVFELAIFRL